MIYKNFKININYTGSDDNNDNFEVTFHEIKPQQNIKSYRVEFYFCDINGHNKTYTATFNATSSTDALQLALNNFNKYNPNTQLYLIEIID